MSEMTHEMTDEEALHLADALVGRAVKETEARCRLLAQFIDDCDRAGSRTAAWSEALRELHELHGRRRGLMRRRSLIQEALDCPVGDSPATAPLVPPPNRTVPRVQHQVQVQARRHRS
jgi:hypothetical protein